MNGQTQDKINIQNTDLEKMCRPSDYDKLNRERMKSANCVPTRQLKQKYQDKNTDPTESEKMNSV